MSESKEKRSTYEIKNDIDTWEDIRICAHRDATDAHFEFEDSILDMKRIQEYMLDLRIDFEEDIQMGKRMAARAQAMVEDYTRKFNFRLMLHLMT